MIPDFIYDPPMDPPKIVFEDDLVLVIDKQAGLLSVPGKLEGREDCLIARLQSLRAYVFLVHRLDCDTSGLIIFAKTKAAQGYLGQEFEQRRAKKIYVARVAGDMADETGHVDLPLSADWPNRPRQMVNHEAGRPAQTDWRVIGRTPGETRVALAPHTGRSHQLRVHMLALGHPILGDPIYATGAARAYPRLMLHARNLGLHHPGTGDWVDFTAPPPF